MGNTCGTCCGNKDTNEVVTERNMKGKGITNSGLTEGNGRSVKAPAHLKSNTGRPEDSIDPQDHFRTGDLEINNDAYNNPRVMVRSFVLLFRKS